MFGPQTTAGFFENLKIGDLYFNNEFILYCTSQLAILCNTLDVVGPLEKLYLIVSIYVLFVQTKVTWEVLLYVFTPSAKSEWLLQMRQFSDQKVLNHQYFINKPKLIYIKKLPVDTILLLVYCKQRLMYILQYMKTTWLLFLCNIHDLLAYTECTLQDLEI